MPQKRFPVRMLFERVARLGLFTCATSLMLTTDASAYLDPGTGSMLMQALLAALSGLLVTLRLSPSKLKKFVTRILKPRSGDADRPKV